MRDTLVEIDLIGYVPRSGLKHEVIKVGCTATACLQITPRHHSRRVCFCGRSGCEYYKTGVPPEARKHANFPFYGSDIKLQARYILNNLKQTLEAAGSSLDTVVKAQVFMTDLKNFCGFDEVWKEFFKVPPPRTWTEMPRLFQISQST